MNNKRLEKIYSLIDDGIGVIDVGTDHGYLPTELALNGYSGNLIASDINPEPLNCAKHTAKEAGVYDKLSFVLGNGLSGCDRSLIDTIVIAGMGGDLICSIIDDADWCRDSRFKFILQPMTKNEILRYYLVNNGFSITREQLVKDAGTVYQIIVAQFTNVNSSVRDYELYSGIDILQRNNALYNENFSLVCEKFKRIIAGISKSEKKYTDSRYGFYFAMLEDMENNI